MIDLTRRLAQAKFEFRSLVAREPRLAPLHRPVIWWTQYKMRGHIDARECRVGPHTEFVLDGFQGSGNSFATVAFKHAQERPVRIAHHLHSPAQIIKAVEQNIPTLVTIREPDRAAVSLVSRWPYVSLHQALRSYVGFYDKITPYVDGFVLSPFTQTTRHLDRVIEAVNRRFDCDFTPFRHTKSNVEMIRGDTTLAAEEERERQAAKARLLEKVRDEACRSILTDAERIYHRLLPYGVGTSK